MDFGQNQNVSNDLEAFEANQKYMIDAFHREKAHIEEEQNKLNKEWDEELKRRESAGYFYPLSSMFYDGTATQHNQKVDDLQKRSKNNQKILEDII